MLRLVNKAPEQWCLEMKQSVVYFAQSHGSLDCGWKQTHYSMNENVYTQTMNVKNLKCSFMHALRLSTANPCSICAFDSNWVVRVRVVGVSSYQFHSQQRAWHIFHCRNSLCCLWLGRMLNQENEIKTLYYSAFCLHASQAWRSSRNAFINCKCKASSTAHSTGDQQLHGPQVFTCYGRFYEIFTNIAKFCM